MTDAPAPAPAKEYIAAIDLGTTTCRLLIAEVTPKGPHVVDSFVRVVRLGEGLATKGYISEAALDRTITALVICAEKLKSYPLARTRYVATAACRNALNRNEVLQKIKVITGLELEVISVVEEARLAIVGCSDLLDNSTNYALGLDIGGGSTEIMWMELSTNKLPHIVECISLPLGVVVLGETLHHMPNPRTGLQQIKEDVSTAVRAFAGKLDIYTHFDRKDIQLIAASGTLTTLAALHLDLPRYDRHKVNGVYLSSEVIRNTMDNLYQMTREERLNHPCIGSSRADLVLGGVAVFDGLYTVFPVDSVRVADRGVREGLLLDLMHQ